MSEMRSENINQEKLTELKNRLGCTFCSDGIFAEMSLDLADYREKTHAIDEVDYRFFRGSESEIKRAVALVDEEWIQYFDKDQSIFCGYKEGQIVSFCTIEVEKDCILSTGGINVGAVGCVGTLPQYRDLGIGLRMVDLATLFLKNAGCDKAYIHYTHIDKWYEKLGYQTFARFSFR